MTRASPRAAPCPPVLITDQSLGGSDVYWPGTCQSGYPTGTHWPASKELPSYRSQNQTKLQVGKENKKIGERVEGSQNKRMLKFVITYLISSNNDSNHNSLPIS